MQYRPPLIKRIFRFLRRLIILAFWVIVIGAAGLYIFSTTDTFREYLRDKILSLANENLQGQISFRDFRGNVLTGFEFDNFLLLAAGDTVVYTRRLTVRYDLEPLLRKTIAVNHLGMERPRIKLLRSSLDSTWNIEHIVKPSADTSASEPFDWTIKVRNLDISKASFIRKDSTVADSALAPPGRFRFDDLRLEGLDARLVATANLKRNSHNLQIKKLAFMDEHSGLDLRALEAEISVDTQRTDVHYLAIRTRESDLKITASLRDVNVLGDLSPEDWQEIPAYIALNAESVSTADLQRFLPELDFLAGNVGLRLNARGNYGSLTIENLEVDLDESHLAIEGQIDNLHRPEQLFIRATIDKTSLSDRDVRNHVPGLDIPDLAFLGTVHIDKAGFLGEPQNFSANLSARTAIGTIQGQIGMNTMGEIASYTAKFQTRDANVVPLVKDKDFAGSINGRIEVEGRGFDLAEMNSRFRIDLDNSSIAGRSFRSLLAVGKISDGGLLKADTLQIRWNRPEHSRDTSGLSALDASGWLSLKNRKVPAYNLSLNLRDFNIRELLPESDVPTAISSTITLNGKGFHPDSLETALDASFSRISTPKRSFDPFEIRILLSRTSPRHRKLSLQSEMADLRLEGEYRFESIANALASVTQGIEKIVSDKYEAVTTIVNDASSMALDTTTTQAPDTSEYIDAEFYLRVRDLSTLALFTTSGTLQADATLSGSMRGFSHNYDVELQPNSGISSFIYLDKDTIYAPQMNLAAAFSNNITDYGYQDIQGFVSLLCDSTIRYNDIRITKPQLRIAYANEVVHYDIRSKVNDDLTFRTRGEFDVSGQEYVLRMDSLAFIYRNEFIWENLGRVHAKLTARGVTLDTVSFQRPQAERITLTGLISRENFAETGILIENFNLGSLNPLLGRENAIDALNSLHGTISEMDLYLNGSWKSPIATLNLRADSLRYNDVYVGNQTLYMRYKDTLVTGYSEIVNPQLQNDRKSLEIQVHALPVNLAFADVDERMVSNRPVDIDLKAHKLSLATIAPFIPAINSLRGFADADFSIQGKNTKDLDYLGHTRFYDASFIVNSTNIKYRAKGKASLRNNRISIDTIRIENLWEDLKGDSRFAVINGLVFLSGFDIGNFDIYLRSNRILVMNQTSRATSPTLYGDLIIRTGRNPLRIYGNLQEPHIKGDVDVVAANLTFPESRDSYRTRKSFCFEMVKEIDGTLRTVERDCPDDLYSGRIISLREKDSVQQQKKSQEREIVLSDNRSFLDRMVFDTLYIGIQDQLNVTMKLGLFEELYTQLALKDPRDGKLKYYSDKVGTPQKEEKLLGELELKKGSSYKFYRTFTPTGTVSFRGAIDNPRLDIKAVLQSQRYYNNEPQKYTVTIHIAGYKDNLNPLRFEYTIDGVDAVGDQESITANALSLIVFGKTMDEIQGSSGAFADNVSSQFGGQLATGLLSNILGNTGVIDNVELDFGGAADSSNVDISKARIKFSGQLGSEGTWRYESDVDDLSSSSFSFEIPLGFLISPDNLRSLFLEISKSAGTSNKVNSNQKEWEFKIGWKKAF